MKTTSFSKFVLIVITLAFPLKAIEFNEMVFEAGDISLREWILPSQAPHPKNNKPTPARVSLGKMLFFDPRMSGDGNMSCATCHNALLGWSDALPTTKGSKSKVLRRASPSIINTAFNTVQMWDGRKKSLEDQAIGPMESAAEMNTDFDKMLLLLNQLQGYIDAFSLAYPGEVINKKTIAKAIASYERTILSNSSPFDAWIKGDKKAMTVEQIEGFKLFVNPDKGNCAVCHSAPNFTDNGFHNIGLESFGFDNPDMGRFAQKPLKLMKGAFKTPTLRDINRSSPYFHDGSADTLIEVIEHYVLGGENKTNLSPNMKKSNLNKIEKQRLLSFLNMLSSPNKPITLPILPQNKRLGI